MDVTHGHRRLTAPATDQVVTLGVFDGVHLGHQAVLQRCLGAARQRGARATAITFDRHPLTTLGVSAPASIVPLEERLRRIGDVGLDACLVLEFDAALAAMSADAFARELLTDVLGARLAVLGYDCRFGRGGEGDAAFLAAHPELDLDAIEVPPVEVAGEPVSSTAVREAISAGELQRAARLLGRPVGLRGTVIRGDGRGRQLGYPTANVSHDGFLLPPAGVYRATAVLPDGRPTDALVNIGTRPTFDDATRVWVEAYLPGFSGDLYGETLALELQLRLREERRFESRNALVAQIRLDLQALESTGVRGAPTRPGCGLPSETGADPC